MTEREELERAISALEAQRATLGDAVVNASLGALRDKLAAMEAAARPDQQRKQVTILFMDVVGSTAMTHRLDPEDNLAMMEAAMRRLSAPVTRHGGRVTRFMGDGFLAVFGHPRTTEHDPDNAVQAGMAILEEANQFAREVEANEGISGFDVRVGVNTGMVIIGGEAAAVNSVAGAAINLAARLESAAQPGTVIISHETYQHVRGVFDIRPLPPIEAKGFPEPIPVYQVLRAKARSFRTRRRGVEGIETRLVGRERELKALQDAYELVLADSERQMATIFGEAGLGKSRLLYEFENWVDLQPASIALFRGRARQETEHLPYGLFRDLFAFRFGLLDGDSAETTRAKFVAGFWGAFDGGGHEPEALEMKAHFVGHLLGYGFGASPHLWAVSGDAQQLRDRAVIYLTDYFKTAAARTPVLILLEDLHWADDSSLDLLNRLALAIGDHPVLLVAAARPDLVRRRPHWMEGYAFHLRLNLQPLSRRESRQLTQEVLQKVADIPDALRELIVSNAEGNPFFVEELVKMLIGEGVIVKGEPTWRVLPERLAAVRVPSTLTGVLQARLDALTDSERTLIQRASVVGRVFWKQVVAYFSQAGDGGPDFQAVSQGLLALREKELVFRRETSTFSGAEELIFKHALLRDVAYESVLKQARRRYHTLAAEWLVQQSGDRVAEFSGFIAEHLERAGRKAEALGYMRRAAEEAVQRYAHEEAAAFYARALALVEKDDLQARFELLMEQEKALGLQGRRDEQRQSLQALEALAARLDNAGSRAEIALRQANLMSNTGEYTGAVQAAAQATKLAEAAGDAAIISRAQTSWGFALRLVGRYQEAIGHFHVGLDYARRADDPLAESNAFNSLGLTVLQLGEIDEARGHLERAAELARQANSLGDEEMTLNNLGNVISSRGDYETARSCYKRAHQISRAIGNRRDEGLALGNVGWVEAMLGRYADARRSLGRALAIQKEIGHRPSEAYITINMALVAANLAEYASAQEYAQRALEIVTAMGDRPAEAFALTFLGHALLGLGDLAAARDAYVRSETIHHQLEQHHLALEPQAGLILIALDGGDIGGAVVRVDGILAFLEGGGTLDGLDEPLRVYVACYRALEAAGNPRAARVLAEAHRLLQEWAAKIPDGPARRSFLESVPWHREIIAAARAQGL